MAEKLKIFLTTARFENYISALNALGAQPCFDGPEKCDGLLLPGGGDVNPRRYGQENAGSAGIDDGLDERELAAVKLFAGLGRPVLGICRGCQVLNVAFGGTLLQDIPDHRRVMGTDALHPVVTRDDMLRGLYGERFTVNSAHHQAVDVPGTGLRAVQWADDGVIEAIRHDTLPILGVQWHPERLRTPTDGWLLISRWLTDAAERKGNR
jgi:putative glutamine amidotransferase